MPIQQIQMAANVSARVGRAAWLVVTVVAVAWIGSYWFWQLSLRPEPPVVAAFEGRPGGLALDIRNRRLFGVAGDTTGSSAASSGSTAMVLAGIVSTGSGRKGVAVISMDGRKALAFEVGQEIAPGVVLSRVAQDHVELRRDGGTVVLELAKKK